MGNVSSVKVDSYHPPSVVCCGNHPQHRHLHCLYHSEPTRRCVEPGCNVHCTNQFLTTTIAFAGQHEVVNPHVLDLTVCAVRPTSTLNKAAAIPELVFATVLCTLLIIRFMRESFQMYKLTKQWRVNSYIDLFVKEGILYFIMCVPTLILPADPLASALVGTNQANSVS